MKLNIGDISDNGQVTIIDEDRLCYLVKSESRGAYGLRTISKSLLLEYVNYFANNPNASANDARDALCGSSDIDKFEYGYSSTLKVMAQMVLGQISFSTNPTNTISRIRQITPLQQIYYGAPGTGKSHEINKKTAGHAVIRTTFHPDSDYSTFVGCYKPSMMKADLRDGSGHVIKDASEAEKKKITYKFVRQAFLKAYLGAWKKYAEAAEDGGEPQFLVIEEINRGNCAQIFGDLFQLLDREDSGFSSYPVDADTDLQQEIANAFSTDAEYKLDNDINAEGAVANYTSNYGETLSDDIQNGRVLLLPPNLYIWATMNTSDQSLFPIDSAFKRRWDWKYMPINTKKENWSICVNGKMYSWSSFLDKINYEIGDQTSSEDKKLGFYFCKAENGEISAERFVSKVLFYIYNDVFKDYEFDRKFFKRKSDNKVIAFQSLYDCQSGNVDEVVVAELLDNLEVDKEEMNPNE